MNISSISTILAVLSPWIASATVLGVSGTWVKKNLPKILANIKKDAPILIQGAETAAQDAGKLFGWPGLAAAKAPLELELHSVTDKLKQAQVVQVASSALQAFGKDLTDLTKNEKGTAIQFVETKLGKLGITLDLSGALHALREAQAAADKLRSTTAFTYTQSLDKSLERLKQVETPPEASSPAAPLPSESPPSSSGAALA